MSKQLFNKPLFILLGIFALLAVVAFRLHAAQKNSVTVEMTCPQKIDAIKGGELLWESFSKQFVSSSLIN